MHYVVSMEVLESLASFNQLMEWSAEMIEFGQDAAYQSDSVYSGIIVDMF
jgi:hypothetical protein